MAYFRYLIATALVILALAATTNFIADPAGVYRPNRNNPIHYADALVHSEYGLWWPENSFEDREIKKALTKYSSQAECVLIGSSHVMPMGSAPKTSSLTRECSSILNLGVSGASIEDHFALVYLSLKNGHPNKIVLGIDPWTFAFGKDLRWSYYSGDYQQARETTLGHASKIGNDEGSVAFRSKVRNLFSLAYTIRSMGKIAGDIRHGTNRYATNTAPKLDETFGGEHAALLHDGSLQYSAKSIAQAKVQPIPLGGDVYKTDGVLNDPGAINAYRSLLRWIKSNGTEPILLLTPYHQHVWKSEESINTRALKATEPIVRQLASELGLSVVGTYNPDSAGCLATEFTDFMHPMPECLARLGETSVK